MARDRAKSKLSKLFEELNNLKAEHAYNTPIKINSFV